MVVVTHIVRVVVLVVLVMWLSALLAGEDVVVAPTSATLANHGARRLSIFDSSQKVAAVFRGSRHKVAAVFPCSIRSLVTLLPIHCNKATAETRPRQRGDESDVWNKRVCRPLHV